MFRGTCECWLIILMSFVVRLGNSGLKVSKIILGTMQYGLKEWADWVLGEEEAIKHIKYAYVKWKAAYMRL